MTAYTEQILYIGKTKRSNRVLSEWVWVVLSTKRYFLLPTKKRIKWRQAESIIGNIDNIDSLVFEKGKMTLESGSKKACLSGRDVDHIYALLVQQKNVLALDQIQVEKKQLAEAVLHCSMFSINGKTDLVLLTHSRIYLGGSLPLLANTDEPSAVLHDSNTLNLKINDQHYAIVGPDVFALFVLLQTIKKGHFPISKPKQCLFNQEKRWVVICRSGLAIQDKKVLWLAFDQLSALEAIDNEAYRVSFLNQTSIQRQLIELDGLESICRNGYFRTKKPTQQNLWHDLAICRKKNESLVFGRLSYSADSLSWTPANHSDGWTFRGSKCSKEQGDHEELRIKTPLGTFAFDTSTGRMGQTELWLSIENETDQRPSSPVAEFINKRAAVRLGVNKKTNIKLLENPQKKWDLKTNQPFSCQLLNLSFGGCALLIEQRPNSFNSDYEYGLLEIIIPAKNKKISVQGIIIHFDKLEINQKRPFGVCGIRFVNLTEQQKHEIYNETMRLERKQLNRMEMTKKAKTK